MRPDFNGEFDYKDLETRIVGWLAISSERRRLTKTIQPSERMIELGDHMVEAQHVTVTGYSVQAKKRINHPTCYLYELQFIGSIEDMETSIEISLEGFDLQDNYSSLEFSLDEYNTKYVTLYIEVEND